MRSQYQVHHDVSIDDEVLQYVATVAARQIPERPLPGKAIDLLDQASAMARIRAPGRPVELRDYDQKIQEVRRRKEAEIDLHNFEAAARARDEEKHLLAARAAKEMEWKSHASAPAVSEADVADALAIASGASKPEIGYSSSNFSRRVRRSPSPFAAEDPSVWAIS